MSHRILALVAPFALLLSACDPQAPREETPAASAPASASIAEAVLEHDGFTPANPAGGTALKLVFGAPRETTIEFLTGMQGGRAPALFEMAECPVGPLDFAEWGDGLLFVFQNDRFVGWSARANAPEGVSTIAGVRAGSTVAELQAAYPGVALNEESIGVMFTVEDGVYGVLSGTDSDPQTVDSLWAGVACIFH